MRTAARPRCGGRHVLTTVGCDLGGTSIKLARLRGDSLEQSMEVPTPATHSSVKVVAAIAEAIRRLCGGESAAAGGVGAVALAVPGFLGPRRRKVIHLSNVTALDGVPLHAELRRRLRLPLLLDTDTNAGAVAEALLGAGREFDRVLYITLGTGLGAALTVGGEPVRVSRHTAGQVAHVPIEESGRRCRCGRRGCAEAELCAAGILWRARRGGVRGAATTRELHEAAHAAGREQAARRRAARQAWREVGSRLGRLATTLGCLFAPQVIVVGGGVARAAELFLPAVSRHVEKELAPRLGAPVAVRAASGGTLAGAVGAALLARRAAE